MKKKLIVKFVMTVLCIAILSQSVIAFAADDSAKQDKLLRIGVTEDLDTLNPFTSNTASSYEIFLLTYDPLVAFDKNLESAKSLAESWKMSDDGLTWTFNLKKDIKWQDGEPFTAADVKFSYEAYQKHTEGMYSGAVMGIKTIDTPDDNTVIMTTENPKANMLLITAPIVPKHIWEKISDYDNYANTDCVGTGAYKLKDWKKGDACTLESNKEYFGGSPKVDGIVYKLFTNGDTMAQSLKNGELDIAEDLTSSNIKTIKDDKNITTYNSDDNEFYELAFNCSTDSGSKGNPALKNSKVRKAIETALDKSKIISLAYNGDGDVADTIIPKVAEKWHYTPDASEVNSYDVDKANKILDDEGYTNLDKDGYRLDENGKELKLSLVAISDATNNIKASQMIKSYLKEIKINVDLSTMDTGALNDKIANMDYDMFVWDWVGDVDPSTLLTVLTTDNIGDLNDANFSCEEFDKLVAEQETKIDDNERKKVIDEAQKVILREVPYAVIEYSKSYEAVRTDKVTGYAQTLKTNDGPIFFANTPANYFTVSLVSPNGINTTAIVASCVGGVVLIAVIVLIIVIKHKKRNLDDEE